MCPSFTDDEIGKPVENDAGESVGIVTSVEGDIAHVRPATDVVDSIKSSIGWDGVAEATQPLDSDTVREITDDAVRLSGDLPTADDASSIDSEADSNRRTDPTGGSVGLEETDIANERRDETDKDALEESDAIEGGDSDMIDRSDPDRGLEADPTELGRREPEAEFNPGDTSSRTDAAVEPDDDHRSTDAEVDIGGEPRQTDAEVDPGGQPRRTDIEVDPDAARDSESDRDSGDEDER